MDSIKKAKCPHCGCNLIEEAGFDTLELGIGGMTGMCDECEGIVDVELGGEDKPIYYVTTHWAADVGDLKEYWNEP